jgi:AcrR family transcriptional regulator
MNEIRDVFRALCKALGYSKALVNHYVTHKPEIVDALNDGAELIASLDIDLERLDVAMDDWKKSDWRGKRGERPTALQFAEHVALWWESAKNQREDLEKLNKRQSWYAQMLNKGFTGADLDAIIYKAEAKRDKRWGKYCT